MALIASATLGSAEAHATDLKVMVDGVRVGPGSIRVALYADADSFRHEEHAIQVLSAAAKSGAVAVVFKDIPPGQYASVAYHDANDNQKLDLNLGMFPAEGWGLSNDPSVIGPPRFGPSAFDVTGANTSIVVHLHY